MAAIELLAVPNVSEGRNRSDVAAIGAAFASHGVRLLDTHADPDHHRSVFTLAGSVGELSAGLVSGAAETLRRVDLAEPRGVHPHVGAVDVVPLVYLSEDRRGAACAEALVVGDRLGDELDLPVLLYGALAGGRTRASLRRGGPSALVQRLRDGELRPDFGPCEAHPVAGVTLVTARPPLAAFNLELAPPADLGTARAIAARIREGGADGLPGVRALGLQLTARGGVAQVSMNVEDPLGVPLARVVAAVAAHAPIAAAEIVGLVPRAALQGFPGDLPVIGGAADSHVIEEALGL